MTRLKTISVIWGIIAVLIFGGLTTLGFVYKNKTAKYKELEKELVAKTKTYTATDFKFLMNNEEIVISFAELKDNNIMEELKIDNKECNGYVILTFNGVTNYKGFIDCEKYTTRGFDSSKLEK